MTRLSRCAECRSVFSVFSVALLVVQQLVVQGLAVSSLPSRGDEVSFLAYRRDFHVELEDSAPALNVQEARAERVDLRSALQGLGKEVQEVLAERNAANSLEQATAKSSNREDPAPKVVERVAPSEPEALSLCARPSEMPEALRESTAHVLDNGLPRWALRSEKSNRVADVTLAYLIQVSNATQFSVLRRAFDRLYSPHDVYLYLVDEQQLPMEKVYAALPVPLPNNVLVRPAALHADYYVWPRVEVVLAGLRVLTQHRNWDFIVHLSESDYPVRTGSWLRTFLGRNRQTNFIQLEPRCTFLTARNQTVSDDWFWWSKNHAVASCGDRDVASEVADVSFPLAEMERRGFRFARGPEWVLLTRELAEYALAPDLTHFKRLVGAHMGADEIFWQTLVLNIPNFTQRVQSQGWFIRFGHGKTKHSPDTLTRRYEREILDGSYFFMRKVDANDSAGLLQDIDQLPEPTVERPALAHADLHWAGTASISFEAGLELDGEGAWDKHAVACPAEDSLRAVALPPLVEQRMVDPFPRSSIEASVAAHFRDWALEEDKAQAQLHSDLTMDFW